MELWLPGLLILLLLIALGLPVAFAMGLVGFFGVASVIGTGPAFSMLGQTTFDTGLSYTLSVVPLFILMGNFIVKAGMADELYRASYAFLGHRRGGLAMATTMACGGFSAVCGSSLATAATMARVAMPSMRRFGYSDRLAAGVIASGGTLGILIPPSVILIIYGILTQQNIGQLFLAGLIPGILGIIGYMIAVRIHILFNPNDGPAAPPMPMRERFQALWGVWSVLALFLVVVGGIYLGVFTSTEAAGIGAFGAFLIALARRRLSIPVLWEVLVDSARTTAMMFAILIGAVLFSNFVNLAGLPRDLLGWLTASPMAPLTIILVILAMYLVMGAVLESLSMILLTVPIFYPVVEGLGFDLIWFGIIVVVAVEISLITPPIGMNVFVLKSVLRDVPTGTIFKGVIPFVLIDVVRLLLLVFVPSLVLFLPSTM